VIVRNTINEHGLIIVCVCGWVGNAEIQKGLENEIERFRPK
jgi:hypothetical protein